MAIVLILTGCSRGAIRGSGYQPDFRDVLGQITAQVLIVWGREDWVVNYRNDITYRATAREDQD